VAALERGWKRSSLFSSHPVPSSPTRCDSFAALNANPAKAKKPHHRPKTAQEFAEKYMQGYYTIVEDEEAAAAAAAAADHKEAK